MRAWKWCRRRPALALLAFTVACLAILGPLVAIEQARLAKSEAALRSIFDTALARAQRATERATAEANAARRALYIAHMNLVQAAVESGDTIGARQLLDRQIPNTGQEVFATFEGHKTSAKDVALSADGTFVASVGNDARVRIDRLVGREANDVIGRHDARATRVAFSPDGKSLLSVGGGRAMELAIWNVANGTQLKNTPLHSGFAAFMPDGTVLASSKANGFRWLDGHELQQFRSSAAVPGNCIAISPDGNSIACGYLNKSVKLWNARTGDLLMQFVGHEGAVNAVCFSNDGRLLASGEKRFFAKDKEQRIKIWNVQSRRVIRDLPGHELNVQDLTFSPDSLTVASASADHTIRLWRLDTGQSRVLKGHALGVNSISFSPDGVTVASGSDDTTIRLWDVATAETKSVLRGHEGEVTSVAFSPDGDIIASSSMDRTVRLWRAPFGG